MAALASVYVDVRAQTDKFEPDLRRKINRIDGKRLGGSIGKNIGSGMRVGIAGPLRNMAGLMAGAFAAVSAVKVFGGFITDARESEKVGRLTASVIKATGGAAKITAAQVGALATAISTKTGKDDEAIQSGQNMLLTFKGIRNEAGKNNDIFNQASTVLTDMVAAMNNGEVTQGNMSKGAIQLGKALNDPVKGISALSRIGVTFTDQQKKQIKTMVAAGDVAGAQKIILAELKSEFGGAAAASSDMGDRMKVALGNLGEQVGGLLLPVFERFTGFVTRSLVPGLLAMIAAFKDGDVTSDGLVGAFERIGVVARIGWLGIKALIAAFKDGDVTSDGFVGAMERIGVVLRGVFNFVKSEVIPRLVSLAGWVNRNRDFFIPFAAAIGAIVVALKVWRAVQIVLNAVLTANPIGLVVVAIAALVAGMVIAYKRSEAFKRIVDAAFRGVAAAGKFMWDNVLKPVFTALTAFVRNVLGPAVTWWWRNVTVPALRGIAAAVLFAWRSVIQPVFKALTAFVRGVLAPTVTWLFRNIVGPYFRFIGAAVTVAWRLVIRPAMAALVAYWRNVIAPTVMFLWRNVVSPAFRGIGSAISVAWRTVIYPTFTAIRRGVAAVSSAFSVAKTAIGRAWSGLRNAVRTPIKIAVDFINSKIIGNVNRFTSKFGLTIPLIPAKFAVGGMVPGQGSGDRVPALLEPGEYVIRKKRVRQLGVKAMDWLNGDEQRLATGGVVFPLPKGSYRVGQGASGHGYQAQDYPAPLGTPIGSIMAGIVRAATSIRNARGELVSYGRYVAVRHANALESTYAHMQRILVGVGQQVAAGQQIGTVDSTGNSTGNHLHLEIRQNGTRISPHAFLANARGAGNITGAITGFVRSAVAKAAGLVLNPLKGLAQRTIGTDGFRGVLSNIVGQGIDKVLAWLRGKDAAVNAANALSFAGSPNAAAMTRGGAVALGRQMAAARGWDGAQWQSLYALWQGESGWNPRADNPTSTAYGIPQFIASTARAYGIGAREPSAARQIAAGLRYISDRYGNPANAYGAWRNRSPHWYGLGTSFVPETGIYGLHRGEAVIPASQNRGGVAVTVNVYGAVGSYEQVAWAIRNELVKLQYNGRRLGFNT